MPHMHPTDTVYYDVLPYKQQLQTAWQGLLSHLDYNTTTDAMSKVTWLVI